MVLTSALKFLAQRACSLPTMSKKHMWSIKMETAAIWTSTYLFTERYQESYLYEIMHFIDALLNNTEMPVTGRDAKISVLLSMAAKKSFEKIVQ